MNIQSVNIYYFRLMMNFVINLTVYLFSKEADDAILMYFSNYHIDWRALLWLLLSMPSSAVKREEAVGRCLGAKYARKLRYDLVLRSTSAAVLGLYCFALCCSWRKRRFESECWNDDSIK